MRANPWSEMKMSTGGITPPPKPEHSLSPSFLFFCFSAPPRRAPPQPTKKKKGKEQTHNNMITPRLLNHIRHQLGRNRSSTFIFFILTCIWEERKNSCDPFRTCDFTCMNHNAQFHESGVDLTTTGIDDVYIVFSNGFDDSDTRFAYSGFGDFCSTDGDT